MTPLTDAWVEDDARTTLAHLRSRVGDVRSDSESPRTLGRRSPEGVPSYFMVRTTVIKDVERLVGGVGGGTERFLVATGSRKTGFGNTDEFMASRSLKNSRRRPRSRHREFLGRRRRRPRPRSLRLRRKEVIQWHDVSCGQERHPRHRRQEAARRRFLEFRGVEVPSCYRVPGSGRDNNSATNGRNKRCRSVRGEVGGASRGGENEREFLDLPLCSPRPLSFLITPRKS